ncbi:MAG: N-acetylglucosamine kinase [Nocardioidaceae bacterium]
MRALVVAIDGGNSKTDAVLVTERGEVLAHVRGPGSSPHRLGADGAARLLDDLVRELGGRAGARGRLEAARAEVYLAGADLPAEVAVLRQAVDAAGWAERSVVDNDGYAILRAGTGRPDAVAVVCGSGINCVGRAGDGRTSGFPSLGRITGDWGGGVHVGYEALWHAARAEDGRGEPTALRQAVAAHFGRATVAEVGEGMHFGSISERRVAELSRVLFRAAEDGDRVAAAVVDRLTEEIALLVAVTLRRLGLAEAPATAVLGGGVVRAHHDVLVPFVRRRLDERAPKAEIVVVTDPPVLGAALYGLDALGATVSAKRRVADEVRRLLP